MIGNPYANVPAGHYFNPGAFAPPGDRHHHHDSGSGQSRRRFRRDVAADYTNVDATMSKFIPLFGERRGLKLQAQAYNVLNHPEFIGLGSGMTYDASGNQTSLTAGVFNSTLPARIMAFSARFEF